MWARSVESTIRSGAQRLLSRSSALSLPFVGGRIVAPVRTMGTAVTEVLMEPKNRPYVDSDTEPGDAGTEEWADTLPGSGAPVGRGPLADPVETTVDDGVVEGSPADEFINDPNAIGAHNDEGDRA